MLQSEYHDDLSLLESTIDLWLKGALVRVPWMPDDTPWREWLGVTRSGVDGYHGWVAALYKRSDQLGIVLGVSRVCVPPTFVTPKDIHLQAWTPETHADRLARVERVRAKHQRALSTPLASAGNISPLQLHRMSARARADHDKNLTERLAVDSIIKHLSQTDDELAKLDRWRRAKLIQERITAAEQRLVQSEMVGRGKNDKLKPTWVKIVAAAQAELDKWKPILAEIEQQGT